MQLGLTYAPFRDARVGTEHEFRGKTQLFGSGKFSAAIQSGTAFEILSEGGASDAFPTDRAAGGCVVPRYGHAGRGRRRRCAQGAGQTGRGGRPLRQDRTAAGDAGRTERQYFRIHRSDGPRRSLHLELRLRKHRARGQTRRQLFRLTSKSEISYTYTSNIAFAFSAFTAYTRWSNVTVAQDTLASQGDGVFLDRLNRLSFDGLSGEFLVRLVTRGPNQPVAVTAAVEPRWSYVDFVTGYRADGYAAEFKLLIDFALTERLFGAVNLNYALGTQKFDIPNARWESGSGTNVSAALTAQIHAAEKQTVEGVFVGVEGRYRTLFDGLWLDRFAGDVFNFGPTLAVAFAGDRILTLAWSPQVAGRVSPATPGGLNLTHADRLEFRVKFETPL